ncbi:hypothetical protein NNRS527_01768 [Nitrosospira sp. NRS527]|nr:hypothetical protein NNRS527_01768 [Nitrosospira sp. NRS527]
MLVIAPHKIRHMLIFSTVDYGRRFLFAFMVYNSPTSLPDSLFSPSLTNLTVICNPGFSLRIP